MGYGSALAVILFLFAPRRRPALPALRPAPRHRRRHHAVRRLSRWRRRPRPSVTRGRRPRQPSTRRRTRAARSRAIVATSCCWRSPPRSSCRSLYAVLGGFKDQRPAGRATRSRSCPDPWVFDQLHRRRSSARTRRVLGRAAATASSSRSIAVGGHGRAVASLAAFVFARIRVPGPRGALHAVRVRAAVPDGGRDPAAVHPHPRPRAARQPARRRAARRPRSRCRSRSSSCGRSSGASRRSSRTRPRSTAAARSGSSGGSSCRSSRPALATVACSRSWPPGTRSCCRWSC